MIALVVVVALVGAYLACGRGGGRSPSPTQTTLSGLGGGESPVATPPAPSMSAANLLAASLQAVHSEKWMSVSDETSSTASGVLISRSIHAGLQIGNAALYLGKTGTDVAEPAGASQQDGRSVEIVADTPNLLLAMGFPAAARAKLGVHRHVRLAPGDPPYQAVSVGLTIGSVVSQVRFQSPLLVKSTVLTDPLRPSQPAYEIDGRVGDRGQATLFVSPEAPYLPLKYESVERVAHEGTVTTTLRFQDWGQAIVGQIPQDSKPYAKVR